MIDHNLEESLEILNSKRGKPTAKLNGLYLHSKYDPEKEAINISREQKPSDMFVIAGLGLGYIAEAISKQFPNKVVVIYEPSINLYNQAIKVRDLSELMSRSNIYPLIGTSSEMIKNYLIPQSIKTISYVPNSNRIKGFEQLFDPVKESIRLYKSRLSINKNTLIRFGKLWVKNQTKNLPLMTYKEDITRVFGKFNNIPGIIISAGPSMELIIPYLKEIQNKYLILAVDTAFKSLLEEGIEPDFVMSIDSQYWNARHLEGVKTKKSYLIADSSIQPSALRSFEDRVYFTSSAFPIGKYFEAVRDPFPKIASGGSVSTNIWDFALKLGLKEIYFIGQDLGFPGNITHYKNSYFEKNMLISSKRTNPLETQSFNYIYGGYPTTVLSNSGNNILSDKRMSIYIDWFTEKLQLGNIKNCFNLSPDGCAIPGLPLKSISNLLERPNCRESINLVLSNLSTRDNSFFLKEIFNAALDFKKNLVMITDLANKAYELTFNIEKKFKRKLDINSDLKTLTNLDNKIVAFNHSQTLSFIIEPFISQISNSEQGSALEGLIISRELYLKILKTGKLHIKYINHSIKKLGKRSYSYVK